MSSKPGFASPSLDAKPSLTLRRRLNAPPPRVYEAWTDPAKMMRWFAPANVETLRAETDPKVGGRFRVLMRTPDGEQHDVSGVYREVVPNEKGVHLGVAQHAGAGVAGHGDAQTRWQWNGSDIDARAILRRSRA